MGNVTVAFIYCVLGEIQFRRSTTTLTLIIELNPRFVCKTFVINRCFSLSRSRPFTQNNMYLYLYTLRRYIYNIYIHARVHKRAYRKLSVYNTEREREKKIQRDPKVPESFFSMLAHDRLLAVFKGAIWLTIGCTVHVTRTVIRFFTYNAAYVVYYVCHIHLTFRPVS